MPLTSHAIEEPGCDFVRKLDTVELRRYAPPVVLKLNPILDALRQRTPLGPVR